MNRIKKKITVHFFSIETHNNFFSSFNTEIIANKKKPSKVITLRSNKCLLKLSDKNIISDTVFYSVTVIRERNTWQTKVDREGNMSGISINQGIIGDPYFFFVVPSKKLLLGFTTGPSGSLKSVGRAMLGAFNTKREEKINLNLIPKEKEFSTLKGLPSFSSLHFKINSSSISDISESTPQLIKDLSSAPYIENNVQLKLDMDINDSSNNSFTKENAIEIINYLSDHEGCTVLKIKGTNAEGTPVHLDFANAFFNYNTDINTRNKYIDESSSAKILNEALSKYLESDI